MCPGPDSDAARPEKDDESWVDPEWDETLPLVRGREGVGNLDTGRNRGIPT